METKLMAKGLVCSEELFINKHSLDLRCLELLDLLLNDHLFVLLRRLRAPAHQRPDDDVIDQEDDQVENGRCVVFVQVEQGDREEEGEDDDEGHQYEGEFLKPDLGAQLGADALLDHAPLLFPVLLHDLGVAGFELCSVGVVFKGNLNFLLHLLFGNLLLYKKF